MKKERFMSFLKENRLLVTCLFVMVLSAPIQVSASVHPTPEIESPDPYNELLLLAIAATALAFGLQTVAEGSDDGSSYLKEIADVSERVKKGEMTSANWHISPGSMVIMTAFEEEYRKKQFLVYYYNTEVYTAEGKKKIIAALDALADLCESKGISFCSNPVYKYALDELLETIKAIDEFDPRKNVWTARWNWIWRAISEKEFKSWADLFFNGAENMKPRFVQKLEKLAAAFAARVRAIDPSDQLFEYHNEDEEALMREQLGPKVEVHKIGIEYKDWHVELDHNKEPVIRFKRAYAWGRHLGDDTGYCRLFQVNLKQDYQGSGKYSPTYATWLDSWPRACPAGIAKPASAKAAKTAPKEKSKSKASAKAKTKKK